jgi:hypothetical protein
MPRYSRDGKKLVNRPPKVRPPGKLTEAVSQTAAAGGELERKRDELERAMPELRRQLRQVDADLDRRWPVWQITRKRRLEQLRASIDDRLGRARIELARTGEAIEEAWAVQSGQHAAARAAVRPAKTHTMACPGCGREITPSRTAPSGEGVRRGEYDCLDCDRMWSATWTGGDKPVVKTGF